MGSSWTLLALIALLPGCRCSRTTPEASQTPQPTPTLPAALPSTENQGPLDAQELTWQYPDTAVGQMQVVVLVPARKSSDERFPVLIAMHGRGEALKGPAAGARGWIDDYWLPQALQRLRDPPLKRQDFLDLVDPDRLEALNAELDRRPYAGLIVVCPYTPDRLRGNVPFDRAAPLATFLVDELLPRVRRETPALDGAHATGIDGVSLGGRASLLVGLQRPEAFSAIAALQPAFDEDETAELAHRASQAVRQNPELRLRLVTSSRDYYLRSTRALARALRSVGVEPNLFVAKGSHSYDFNRGPGAYEMIVFHDRALRGLPWP